MTGDPSGLTGTTPTVTVAMATINNGQGVNDPGRRRHVQRPHRRRPSRRRRTPTISAARSCGSRVKAGDIAPAERTRSAALHRPCRQPVHASARAAGRDPEIYAMGFRNPFRITGRRERRRLHHATTRPIRRSPTQFRGPAGHRSRRDRPRAGQLRLAALLSRPTSRTTSGTSTRPRRSLARPRPRRTIAPTRPAGRKTRSRWVASGGPTVDPGLEYGPPITNPEVWYSYRDNQQRRTAAGDAVLRQLRTERAAPARLGACPQLFPELFTGGVGPHGTAPYDYDPTTRTRPSSRRTATAPVIAGEFTQDTLREVRIDSQQRDPQDQQHVAAAAQCPATPTRPFGSATTRWTWSSGPTARSTC